MMPFNHCFGRQFQPLFWTSVSTTVLDLSFNHCFGTSVSTTVLDVSLNLSFFFFAICYYFKNYFLKNIKIYKGQKKMFFNHSFES